MELILTHTRLIGGILLAVAALVPGPIRAEEGPTLAATLDFIVEQLNAKGPIGYHFSGTKASNGAPINAQFIDTVIDATANPVSCNVRFHEKLERNAKIFGEGIYPINLSQIKDVKTESIDSLQQRTDAKRGTTDTEIHATPSVMVVEVLGANGNGADILFYDESVADRIAKAFAHAAKLCGGLKADAF